jgi:hypothetical protein
LRSFSSKLKIAHFDPASIQNQYPSDPGVEVVWVVAIKHREAIRKCELPLDFLELHGKYCVTFGL